MRVSATQAFGVRRTWTRARITAKRIAGLGLDATRRSPATWPRSKGPSEGRLLDFISFLNDRTFRHRHWMRRGGYAFSGLVLSFGVAATTEKPVPIEVARY